MKNIFTYCITVILLTVYCFTATAQTDSAHKNKRIKDSIFRSTHQGHFVADDTVFRRYNMLLKAGPVMYDIMDTTHKKRKTAYRNNHSDSIYKKRMAASKSLYKVQTDSLYKKKYFLSKLPDSLKRIHNLQQLSYDSLRKLYPNVKYDCFHRYKLNYVIKSDSSKRLTALKRYNKTDSLKRLYVLDSRMDSFHRYKMRQSIKLDSLRALQYKQNIKSDSQRIRLFLNNKKLQLQQFNEDTASVKNGYRSRNLSMEITCAANDTVYINNNYKKVIIKVIPAQKLRVSAIVNYREALNSRDHEVFKLMGIDIGRSGNQVRATITTVTTESYRDSNDKSNIKDVSAVAARRELNSETNVKRTVLIELPGNAIIFLTSKFADANIESYVPYVNVTITNGTLKMGSAGHAVIKSKFSTVNTDDIKEASLNLVSTKFTGGNIILMNVVSNNSTLQLDRSGTMQFNSVSDQYQVENAGSITGNKNFGKLNIVYLKDQLILTGANADLKINNVAAGTALIKIDNKYADLKVPVYNLNNYSIQYEGSYRDVNKISVASRQMEGTGSVSAKLTVQKDSLAGYTLVSGGNKTTVKDSNSNTKKGTGINRTVFEAIAGDVKGKHTKVAIVCAFCNVAFK